MGGSDSARIVAREAQRRVALLLLPLRVFVGIAWLRDGLSKALQPEWFDGTALTAWVQGQTADAPISLYTDVLLSAVERLAAPMGTALVLGETAIGLALITGTLTNFALLVAIALNANAVLLAAGSPSQYFIVIQLVLLAGGAGSDISVDRSLSRYLRSPLLTGRRGVVEGPRGARPGLVVLAVTMLGLALGLVAAGAVTVSSVLRGEGVDDPGYTMVALLGVTALLAVSLFAARRGGGDDALPAGATAPPRHVPVLPPRHAPAPAPPHDTSHSGPLPVAAAPPGRSTVAAAPPRRRSAPQPAPQPPPEPRPVQPWPDPSPLMSPVGAGPAQQDQPTTQFSRPTRRSEADRSDDPYAELRDLPY